MKPMGKKVITGAIAAAVVFGGAGLVHNQVFAAASTTDKAVTSADQQNPDQAGGPRGGKFRAEGKRGDFGGFRGGNLLQEAASVLGKEEAAIREELQQGQTLAQIATASGLTEEDFISKLAALEAASLDTAVSSGKLTQEQADTIKSGLNERIKAEIENAGPKGGMMDGRDGKGHGMGPGGMMGRGGMMGHGGFIDSKTLADITGLTEEEIRTQQEAGKSLAEIAEGTGITEDQLIQKIKDSMTDSLKSFVERKGAPAKGPRQAPEAPAASSAPAAADTVIQ